MNEKKKRKKERKKERKKTKTKNNNKNLSGLQEPWLPTTGK